MIAWDENEKNSANTRFFIGSSKVFAVSGNELRVWMIENERLVAATLASGETMYQAGSYDGYVAGVSDSYQSLGIICLRPNVTRGQINRIVAKYIKENPEHLDQDADDVIRNALSKTFPCKQ